jgi:hypothetical protein
LKKSTFYSKVQHQNVFNMWNKALNDFTLYFFGYKSYLLLDSMVTP